MTKDDRTSRVAAVLDTYDAAREIAAEYELLGYAWQERRGPMPEGPIVRIHKYGKGVKRFAVKLRGQP